MSGLPLRTEIRTEALGKGSQMLDAFTRAVCPHLCPSVLVAGGSQFHPEAGAGAPSGFVLLGLGLILPQHPCPPWGALACTSGFHSWLGFVQNHGIIKAGEDLQCHQVQLLTN